MLGTQGSPYSRNIYICLYIFSVRTEFLLKALNIRVVVRAGSGGRANASWTDAVRHAELCSRTRPGAEQRPEGMEKSLNRRSSSCQVGITDR